MLQLGCDVEIAVGYGDDQPEVIERVLSRNPSLSGQKLVILELSAKALYNRRFSARLRLPN